MKIFLKTPQGAIRLSGSQAGISEIKFLNEKQETTPDIPDFLLPAVQQLQAYFMGELKEFNLKLDLQGTDFQKKVWQALLEIPYGKTISYLELSRKLGDVKAIRAVASANGKNPVWIVVPCHRVIGSDGSLTGYAGGLARKKFLLEHEGALTQQSLF
ncbi:MAG TPA: methylated-DNA--[protein]-cysteine S-methyltransferase [Salegentibacter sp.]|nr:methylated-DNA--[protein]-cysteine S-methyltransferase [Salegentibacter sp.]